MKAFPFIEFAIIICICVGFGIICTRAIIYFNNLVALNSEQILEKRNSERRPEKGQVQIVYENKHPYGLEKLFTVEDINVYKFVISNRTVLITMHDKSYTAASMLELKE